MTKTERIRWIRNARMFLRDAEQEIDTGGTVLGTKKRHDAHYAVSCAEACLTVLRRDLEDAEIKHADAGPKAVEG